MNTDSQFGLTIGRFRRHKGAMAAFWVLAALYAAAALAPLLAPYSYGEEDRQHSYCPPMAIEFFHQGKLAWPFVYGRQFTFDQVHRRLYVKTQQRYPLRFFHHGRLLTVDGPGRLYLLGADSRGRDLLSRLLYGGRISLSIGLLG